MLRLHRAKHNVSRQCPTRCYSAGSPRTPSIKEDRTNSFVSFDSDAKSTLPDPQSLINAGLENFLNYKRAFRRTGLAVKDNISTAAFPTTCASHALEGYTSPYEATVVSLLRQRGMAVVGKTNMDEFGMGSHSTHSHSGPVIQRFVDARGEEVEYSAGGSSGGSALAVQKYLASVALGTDTGGSVRLPAAWCGVVGFKPSYGLVSRWGVVDYANSFDTVGFLGRTVHSVAKMFSMCSAALHEEVG
jgi:Asp-tRNA(Asn)/Glu-tRNA(Gln) amidotransferase A subunit family amidase